MPVMGGRKAGVMPKKNIYPVANPDGTNADNRVEVGWGRGLGMQIATTRLQPGAKHGEEYIDGVIPGKKAWDGQYTELNRQQCNDLIRTIREARDSAFGRDE